MHKSPVEILFGRYRRKILALLLLRPEEKFHVREIARLTDVPAGSLHRELKLLAEGELLIRSQSGRQVYYQANGECPIFSELAGLFRKTAGLAEVVRDALAPLHAKIELAFIFGSTARGKERAGSDVDLFVVGAVSFAEVVGVLVDTHQRLGREINPVIMSRSELKRKMATDPFVMRLIDEPKIAVRGNLDDFKKLGADRAAEGARTDS